MQNKTDHIPAIDISPLFALASPAREATDRQIFGAASGIGFMTVRGFPAAELLAGVKHLRTPRRLRLG